MSRSSPIDYPGHTLGHTLGPKLHELSNRFHHILKASEAHYLSLLFLTGTSCQETLSKYDDTIAELELLSSSLKRQRDDVERAMDYARSPVRKLPLEILIEIFTFCCTFTSEPSFRTTAPNKFSSSTLRLAQTCSYWRKAVKSRPHLWTFLQIDMGHVTENSNFATTIISWLPKSGRSELKLSISGQYQSVEDGVSHLPRQELQATTQRVRVIRSLVVCESRWQVVRLRLSDPLINAFHSAIPLYSRDRPRLLESLDLTGSASYDGDKDGNSLFVYCPKLQFFAADDLYSHTTIDLRHITRLKLQGSYYGESLAELLRSCPRLEHCELGFSWSLRWIGDEDNNAPLHHNLVELQLRHSDTEAPVEVVFSENLYLPRLSSLGLTRWNGQSAITEVVSLLTRSKSPIKTLKLRRLYPNHAIRLLAATPALSELSVLDLKGPMMDQLLTHLTYTSDSRLVPNLSSLNLCLSPTRPKGTLDSKKLRAMYESRYTAARSPHSTVSGIRKLNLVPTNINGVREIVAELRSHINKLGMRAP